MNNRYIFGVSFILLLAGCGRKSLKPEKEFATVQQTALDFSGHTVEWRDDAFAHAHQQQYMYDLFANGISRDQFIGLALHNNAALQARFENLGIAKADLVQAGLYSNPSFQSVIYIPTNNHATAPIPNTEADFTWSISDLWQVPLRKKVAQERLECTTKEIVQLIMRTYADARAAYDSCIYAQALVKNAQLACEQAEQLYKQIVYRQEFGYTSPVDITAAQEEMFTWQAELIDVSGQLDNAYVEMRRMLFIDPTNDPIKLTDHLAPAPPPSPSFELLEQCALTHRPDLLIAQCQIKEAESVITYEQSRFIDNVQLGIGINRDFDATLGVGPIFNLTLPIFDTNSAQVARARSQRDQAQKNYAALKNDVIAQVRDAYITFAGEHEQVAAFEKMIPSYEDALKYAQTYEKTMQLNELVAMQTRLNMYETQRKLYGAYYDALTAQTALELAIGKRLEEFHHAAPTIAS